MESVFCSPDFRKMKSFKVVDLMSSSDSCPVQPPIANLRDYLVKLLSASPGLEERFSARDVDDAIGVFAVNGVKVGRTLRVIIRMINWKWDQNSIYGFM